MPRGILNELPLMALVLQGLDASCMTCCQRLGIPKAVKRLGYFDPPTAEIRGVEYISLLSQKFLSRNLWLSPSLSHSQRMLPCSVVLLPISSPNLLVMMRKDQLQIGVDNNCPFFM